MMDYTEALGIYFGYPRCCIDAYHKILADSGRKTPEQQIISATNKGFTPCPEHARQITEGIITLESLIANRICPLPFPEEPDISVLDEYLNSLT